MLLNFLLAIQMRWVRFRYWLPFLRLTDRPREIQEQVLLRIIHDNADTDFGKAHRFETIHSYEEYHAKVPVQSYEDLRPYIDRQIKTGAPALTAARPVLYAQTSGTTNVPKLIPIVPAAFDVYEFSQKIFSYAMYQARPQVYTGKVLAIVSPGIEGHLENGVPYGSMSGLIYLEMPALVRKKYVLPREVFAIKDYDEKYKKIAEAALSEKNVTLLASANPSTFMKLLGVIREITGKPTTFAELWPDLQVVATWTGGSGSLIIPELKKLLPPHTAIIEMGYMASEFRGTVTIDGVKNLQVPTLQDTFFEFAEVGAWDNGQQKFLRLDEVEPHQKYYVFITTVSGLYRYHMNDIVEVTGMFHNTPTIRFVQKGKGVTSITGEKLYESQVAEAMKNWKEKLNLAFDFYIMTADVIAAQYILYLESESLGAQAADDLEKLLEEENIEYASKVQSGRLHPVTITYLKPGTGEAFKKYKISKGQREGQYKTMNLQYAKDVEEFNFDSYAY